MLPAQPVSSSSTTGSGLVARAGSDPRQAGHWTCVLCCRRIRGLGSRRIALSRPHPSGGRAHTKCLTQHARQALGTGGPVLGKRARSPSLEQQEAPRSLRPASPEALPAAAASQATSTQAAPSSAAPLLASFQRLGHAILSATTASSELAWHVARLRRGAPGVEIAGKVRQVDLALNPDFAPLQASWHAVVRDAATRVGVSAEQLHVVEQKLLVAAPNAHGGLDQPVHWDCARDAAAAEKFSCLLVCSPGALSTALPRFDACSTLSFSHTPAEMRTVAHLLRPQEYESVPVLPGDIVFFRQSTPHYGVSNSCPRGERVMLFSMLSPSAAPQQDELQVFPWLYAGAAFGWLSREYAQCLVDHRAHGPIQRLELDHGRRARLNAHRCLRLWKLFDSYFP